MTCPSYSTAVPAASRRCAHCEEMLAFAVPASARPAPSGLLPYVRLRSGRALGLAAVVSVGVAARVSHPPCQPDRQRPQ